MKKIILLTLFIPFLFSCSESVEKKIIGKWQVERAEFSTGEVLEKPDMFIVFTSSSYTVYTKRRASFVLDYKVKKDYISHYLETYVNGKKQGERLYFSGDDNFRLELSDMLNGKKIELKYYLNRIKEEAEK